MPTDEYIGKPQGWLSYQDWSKPSQAKWFKKSKGIAPGTSNESVYGAWLEMLNGRNAAAPAPPAAKPPPGGGGGGRPAGAAGAPPVGKPPAGAPRGGNANVGNAPPPGMGPKGGRPVPGGATIASQNRVAAPPPGGMNPLTGGGLQAPQPGMSPIDGGGLQGGGEHPALAAIRQLLAQLQGGQGGYRGSGMGGKG